MKRIKDLADHERVNREILIMKKVRHPHVVQLYDVNIASLKYIIEN